MKTSLLESAMARRQEEQLEGDMSQWRDPWEISGTPRCAKCGQPVRVDSLSPLCRDCAPRRLHCRADGCERKAKHYGYCAKHWRRVKAGLDLDEGSDLTPADAERVRKDLIRKGVIGRRTTKTRESSRRTNGKPPRPQHPTQARNDPLPRGQLDLFGPHGCRVSGRAA